MSRFSGIVVVAAGLVLAGVAVLAAVDQADVDTSRSAMRPVLERYLADKGTLDRYFSDPADPGAGFGRGGRSGAEPMFPAQMARMRRFYREWTDTLAKTNFDALEQDGKIDYLLLSGRLKYELSQLDLAEGGLAEIQPFVPFGQTILSLEEARRTITPVDPKASAVALNQMLKDIAAAQRSLESGGKITREAAVRTTAYVGRLRAALRSWFSFYNGYDPTFGWWVGRTDKDADQALERYATFVQGKFGSARSDSLNTAVVNPVGRAALLVELEREMIPYTPEELVAIANNEFAWCEREMIRASRDLGYGDDWHTALEHVKTQHVAPGEQPQLVKKLVLEGMDYVEKHDLLTVPPLAREAWRMQMMSAERQLVSPFFLGGEIIMVSYPTDEMTFEQKMMSMRGNNAAFARATAFHEMIPGHELQGFMSARYRTYRSAFGTPFWSEGNALWWEMLFWDLGFPRTPEERIGMLFWRMHRCARIIFSLGYHMGTMTPQQAIDLLVQKVGHEVDNATGEVRRSFDGSYPPLYQCAYMLGALQFRALHTELVGSKKMTNRAFHDAILKENRIPVELIRADLTNQKLTRDYKTSWKFYGPIPGMTP